MTNLLISSHSSSTTDLPENSTLSFSGMEIPSSESTVMQSLTSKVSTKHDSLVSQDLHTRVLMFCYGLTVGLFSASFYQLYSILSGSSLPGFFKANMPPRLKHIFKKFTETFKSLNYILSSRFIRTRGQSDIYTALNSDNRLLSLYEFSRTVIHYGTCACFSPDFCYCLCNICQNCNLSKIIQFYPFNRSNENEKSSNERLKELRLKAIQVATTLLFESSIINESESGFQSNSIAIDDSYSDINASQSERIYISSALFASPKLTCKVMPQSRTRQHDADLELRLCSTPLPTSKTIDNSISFGKFCHCKDRIVEFLDQAVQTSPSHSLKPNSCFTLPEDENRVSTTSSIEKLKHGGVLGFKAISSQDQNQVVDVEVFGSDDHYEYDEENQGLLLSQIYEDGVLNPLGDAFDFSRGLTTPGITSSHCISDEEHHSDDQCTRALDGSQNAPHSPIIRRLPKRPATIEMSCRPVSPQHAQENTNLIPERMTKSAIIPELRHKNRRSTGHLSFNEEHYIRLSKLTSSIACELDDVGKSMLSLRNQLVTDDLELRSAENDLERVYDVILDSNAPKQGMDLQGSCSCDCHCVKRRLTSNPDSHSDGKDDEIQSTRTSLDSKRNALLKRRSSFDDIILDLEADCEALSSSASAELITGNSSVFRFSSQGR